MPWLRSGFYLIKLYHLLSLIWGILNLVSGSTLRIRFIRSRAYWLMNFGMSNCPDRIFLYSLLVF